MQLIIIIVFKELGEYQKAKNCYERAIEIDPNFKDAINNNNSI